MHYDLSRCTFPTFRLPKYFFALNDLHNFPIDVETVRSLFRPEFLKSMYDSEKTFNFSFKLGNGTISIGSALSAIEEVRKWNSKNYPETVKENKKILKKILQLLDSLKILPIFVIPPMVKEYQDFFDKDKINELFSYLNELYQYHSFMLVNFWQINIFDEHDFFDIQHLNFSGAKKFSKRLNEIIMELERKF